MIKDPEWEWVRKKLDSYEYWTDDESLKVLSGKRDFERKSPDYLEEIGDYSLKEIVGQMFCIYFDEMGADSPRATAEELYEESVAPSATTALGALKNLLSATERIPRKTLAPKAQKLIEELQAFENDLRQAWIKEFERIPGKLGPVMGILDAF